MQFDLENVTVRIINAYGPQEDDESSKIKLFWQAIETEIILAKDDNCYVILQLDANAKVGREVIKSDPNCVSNNGKMMLEMVERQGFYIANQSNKCRGSITRERVVKGKTENSIIDYFVLCERMKNNLEEMIVDKKRDYVRRKHENSCKGFLSINLFYFQYYIQ